LLLNYCHHHPKTHSSSRLSTSSSPQSIYSSLLFIALYTFVSNIPSNLLESLLSLLKAFRIICLLIYHSYISKLNIISLSFLYPTSYYFMAIFSNFEFETFMVFYDLKSLCFFEYGKRLNLNLKCSHLNPQNKLETLNSCDSTSHTKLISFNAC